MIKAYAIISPKGGTGKTTVSLALAAGLARCKKKVLLIDADQQEDATVSSGIEEIKFSLSDVLMKECQPKDAVCSTAFGYDIIPCYGVELAPLSIAPVTKVLFKKIIDSFKKTYDYIVVDCPPNIFGLTIQVLQAVDEIVFPAFAESFSERSLENVIEEILTIKKTKNKHLSFAGILFNRFHADHNVTKASLPLFEEISNTYGIRIFQTTIPDSIFIKEAQLQKCPIYEVNERNRNSAAPAFESFVKELTGEVFKEVKINVKSEKSFGGSNFKKSPKDKTRNGRKRGWKSPKGRR